MICELAPKHEFSYEGLGDSDYIVEMHIGNAPISAEDEYIARLEKLTLYKSIKMLDQKEKDLIYQLFFSKLTERQLAKKYDISQPAIYKRKQKILGKLKELIKDNY